MLLLLLGDYLSLWDSAFNYLIWSVVSSPGGDKAGSILVKHGHQLPQPRVLLPHWLLRACPLHAEAYEEIGDESGNFVE